ncbi:MAG: TIGR03545 family protein [Candidatus Coatesbacteria bacterium]
MIRWKAVVPGLVTLGLVVVFAVFFLDWTVEWAIEKAGTTMNGARVDLAGVDISWRHASVTLRGLQVTDKAAPMTNALEVETMSFQLAVKPLTWMKVIIEDGEILGVRTGTARKSSGAIAVKTAESVPPKGDGPTAVATAKKPGLPTADLKAQFDPKKIRAEDLESYKMAMGEQARVTAAADQWERTADGINVDGKVAEAKAFLDRVKATSYSGAAGAKKAAEDAKEAQKLQGELRQLTATVNAAKTSITAETAAAKGTVARINEQKKKDVDAELARFGISSLSTEGITRAVIGETWFGRIESGLYWFRKIRAMMPAKKAPPPVRDGRNIEFKFHYKWPAFWLKKARISGVTAGENPIEYKGALTDVTSDPKLVGKPIMLVIDGGKGSRSLHLKAVLDYTQDTARETVSFRYSGMDLAGTQLGDLGGPVSIKDGKGTLKVDLSTRGEAVAGTVDFNAQPVRLANDMSPEQVKQKMMAVLHDTLTGLKRLQVTIVLGGKLTSPSFKVKSSMDSAFKSAVGAVAQRETAAARAAAQARVNGLVDGERDKIASAITGKSGKALGKLGVKASSLSSAQAQVDKVIEDLKKKGTSSAAVGGAGGALKGLKRK